MGSGKVTIEKFYYYGSVLDRNKLNGKVLYRKNGKLYVCHVHVYHFMEKFLVVKDGAKENKALKGFGEAFQQYLDDRKLSN